MGSMGEVQDEARIEPTCGNRSFCEFSVLCVLAIDSECTAEYQPSLDSIDLKVNPPDTRDTYDAP